MLILYVVLKYEWWALNICALNVFALMDVKLFAPSEVYDWFLLYPSAIWGSGFKKRIGLQVNKLKHNYFQIIFALEGFEPILIRELQCPIASPPIHYSASTWFFHSLSTKEDLNIWQGLFCGQLWCNLA